MSCFHEEQRFRQPWLLALPALLLPALLLGPGVIAAVALLFGLARLVVDVDREAITVAFHYLWPKRRIPISEVRTAEATRYSPLLDYGGYGVRLGLRGWVFSVSGDEGVLVETTDGSRLMIGSRHPKELEAGHGAARARRPVRLPDTTAIPVRILAALRPDPYHDGFNAGAAKRCRINAWGAVPLRVTFGVLTRSSARN